MMQPTIKGLSGVEDYRRGGWITWTYRGVISRKEAAEVQLKSGFHPAGYGFYSHEVKDGVTTWKCSNCCD